MSGGIYDNYELKNEIIFNTTMNVKLNNRYDLFKIIELGLKRHLSITCDFKQTNELLAGHAYTITDAKSLSPLLKFIKIHNPYNLNDPFTKTLRYKRDILPFIIKKQLKSTENGEFW